MMHTEACAPSLGLWRSRSTGKERDSESGNDYFGARYYSSAMGRFMSPDWSAKYEPVPYAKLDNPQTLNLYNYMRNNPLAGVDPDGHCCEDEPPDEEVRENENFERDLGEARESLNRREAAEADQREQQSFNEARKSSSGGYDDANGVSHIGPPTREEFERTQAENREKLEKGDVAGALGMTKHGQQRADEAQAGDAHRQVGDANRVTSEGRSYTDSETGNTVHVRGGRVVITDKDGNRVTQFKNTRANTAQRVKDGKWVPNN